MLFIIDSEADSREFGEDAHSKAAQPKEPVGVPNMSNLIKHK